VGVGTAAPNARLEVDATSSGIGQIIKANATTPGDLLQLLDATNIPLVKFSSLGQLTLGTLASSGNVYQGQLVFADGTADNYAITLKTNSAVTGSHTVYLPDETGTICLRNSSSCGFLSGSGSASFINNGLSVQNAANFYIRSNGDSVTGILEASSAQTSDILRLNTYNGTTSTTVAKFDSTGSLVIANSSSNALAIKNTSNQRVAGVDTSTNQFVVGQSSSLNGTLVFKNGTDNNAITLNSTSATTSYSLTLPAAAPAAGLCLETSTGNSTQLVFASCANNNSSITQVQERDANNTNTMSFTPSAVGDEIVLTTQIPTSGVTVASITGGGVSSWNKVVVSNGNGTVNRVEMWAGTVTSATASTITVNYSSAPGTEEITATEFTAAGVNASTSWGIESAGSQLNSTASTAVNYPALTAVNGSELYIGYAQVQNPPATAGANNNFSYLITSTQHNVITYNPALAANTAYQPAANQSSAGQSNTVSAILTAFVTSTSINNTTSLQKANFYVQAASSGSVAGVLQGASSGTADILNLRNSGAVNVMTVGSTGVVTLRNVTDSAGAFQVQNSSGTNILSVNTSTNQTVLGTSGSLAGALTFANSSNSNTITLTAPSTVAASYTLSLPSNTPTAGLCLGTNPDPGKANQLIFASCATQVSAASISYVNSWSTSGTGVTSLADSPTSVGNLVVLYSHATNNVSVTGISGGGVTNWTKVTSNTNTTGQGNNEMWRGVVTGSGSSTINVTYSAAAGANEITAQEFTMGSSSGTWAVDTSGTAINSGSQTIVNYPSLTPMSSSELYTGYAWSQNTMSAGNTTGFTYVATNGGKYLAYDSNVTGGTPLQPTATQSVAGNYNSIAALIAAYAGTSVIVNSTATQQANFNVQAALSGTVAGVLQSASSGTADIMQLKNGAGINVASFNSTTGLTLGSSASITGILTFANSGNSNTIALLAPANIGQTYNLTLPSAGPAPGQCLAASAADSSKLVFSSCANQVTSVAINFVNNWKGTSASNTVTLGVSPANLGDLMTVFVSAQKADTVTSVSGGGVTVWSKVAATSSGSGTDTTSIEMWRGIITTTGASTITANLSGPTGTHEMAAMEFTTGSTSGSWVVDSSNTQFNSTGTAVTFPNITPQSTKDLYVGYGAGSSTVSAGSSPGFTYLPGSLTNRIGLYNNAISAASQPAATQSSSGTSITVGALIAAYSSSSVIANSTVTQQANLNVQAGLSNSVAAVFQAGQSGTADIMHILDITGNVVDSFSDTGNLLIKPSTASSSALQVQTTAGVNVFSVDTSGSLAVIGAGAAGEANPSLLVLDSRTGTTNDPTVLNGAMYYNASSHSFRCGVDGSWQTCSGLLYTNTSTSSANNNCSSSCLAFDTSAPVPANYCQTGRVIRLLANGYFSSISTPSTLSFGVYYGNDGSTAANDTLIGSISPAETVSSAINNYFQLNFNIVCFSTSTMQAEGILNLQTGSSNSGMLSVPMSSTNGTTVVSNTAKNLYIFPIWNTANTSNTATITQMNVNAY
jgi:hypothetical protein